MLEKNESSWKKNNCQSPACPLIIEFYIGDRCYDLKDELTEAVNQSNKIIFFKNILLGPWGIVQ
jgi:hypothetical protein